MVGERCNFAEGRVHGCDRDARWIRSEGASDLVRGSGSCVQLVAESVASPHGEADQSFGVDRVDRIVQFIDELFADFDYSQLDDGCRVWHCCDCWDELVLVRLVVAIVLEIVAFSSVGRDEPFLEIEQAIEIGVTSERKE